MMNTYTRLAFFTAQGASGVLYTIRGNVTGQHHCWGGFRTSENSTVEITGARCQRSFVDLITVADIGSALADLSAAGIDAEQGLRHCADRDEYLEDEAAVGLL